jgi:nitrogen fixation NifU-like protein
MNGLGDLYQQLILDHNAKPKNYGELDNATHTATGDNPLCGDNIKLMLEVKDGVIEDLKFVGSGCAISKSSTSLMTAAVKGLTTEQAEALFERFHDMVTGTGEPDGDALGKLAAFSGVREYPARVKCAILAWHTLRAALRGESSSISTE